MPAAPKPTGHKSQKQRHGAKVRARIDAKAAYRVSRPHECEVCGEGNLALEVHHVVLLSQGGTDDFDNFSLECQPCHGGDHGRKVFINSPLKWSKGNG